MSARRPPDRLCRPPDRLVIATLALLVLGGCATVRPDARFPNVQRAVEDRLRQQVVWDRSEGGGAEPGSVVRALLARPLTAEGAVQLALLNSKGLQAIFEDLGVAQADLVQAGLVRNPSLAGFFRFPDRPPSGLNWNVGVDFWPLDILLVPFRTRLSGAALEAAERRVSRAVLDLAAQSRAAYYALWADERALEAQRDLTELAAIAADLAGRQHAVGNIDDMRLAAERTAHQQASLALMRVEGAVRLGRERLRRIMGLALWEIPWSVVAEQPVPTGGDPDAEELVRLALEQRLDLAAANKETEGLEYALALTRKWWLAPVRIGVETERGSGGQFGTGPHFQADIPVFDQKQAEIARQEALIRQARQRAADLESGISMEVRTALDRVRTARRIARYYEQEVVPLRARVTAMTEQRYQSMTLGVFETLAAKSEETAARIAAARAVRDFWSARSELELAIATRLPERAAVTLPEATGGTR
jgi:cobalt-zinc-cadmium efflux system outer membrane protein